MYSPRFASPCARHAAENSRKKSPARAGLRVSTSWLLLLAEALVAGAADLAHGGVLLLHAGLVFGARQLAELGRLGLQALRELVELRSLLEDRGQRAALLAFGALVETIPRHLREILQVRRIARHDVGVVRRHLARGHAGDRAPVLTDQRHGRLALLDEHIRLLLRGGDANHATERQRHCGRPKSLSHRVLSSSRGTAPHPTGNTSSEEPIP